MNQLLGEIRFPKRQFSGVETMFQRWKDAFVTKCSERERSEVVNRALLELIEAEPEPCFLLCPTLAFMSQVCQAGILSSYTLKNFELWLNQESHLSFESNYRVRAKIAGKLVDRSDYQALFPIGGAKVFEGTHVVTAHRSPDLDTTVASFWGWLDAFAARVGNGLHLWNVPGGPPAQIEIEWLFQELFGSAIFSQVAKTQTTLHVTGKDLMVQKGMLRKLPSDSIIGLEHGHALEAVVVVDERGLYLGDWQAVDAEGVRDVILLLSSCLRWFENALHLQLMEFLGRSRVHLSDGWTILQKFFGLKLEECEPALEFTVRQKQTLKNFMVCVLGVSSGLQGSFEELTAHLARLANASIETGSTLVEKMRSEGLFDLQGHLVEDRSKIFRYLEGVVKGWHASILAIRNRLERLDIALKIKGDVFGQSPAFVQSHADVEEIRNKMGSHSFLTVVELEGEEIYPVGVIYSSFLRKPTLATVSLRDFCNREEMGLPSYFEVISVIDHHKTTLATTSPPFAIIADVQSSNTLVASQAFLINDKHSLLGQTREGMESQLQEALSQTPSTPPAIRLTQNLLQRRMSVLQNAKFFVHPEREFVEYLHFLYAILDDTDLLSKVTPADVECVAELLNRMKSLSSGRICEIIALDDLPRNRSFARKGADRILQNEEMYSIYRKVYDLRERDVDIQLALAAEGRPSHLFADTKEQNGCCRVGQTKIFASNLPLLTKLAPQIRQVWQQSAEKIAQEKPAIVLHLHMVSTVVDAHQVYRGGQVEHPHKDEMWIWVSSQEGAEDLLKRFISSLTSSPSLANRALEVEFWGERAESLSHLWKESNATILQKISPCKGPTFAVLRFDPGVLNSRKATVTPFLPIPK